MIIERTSIWKAARLISELYRQTRDTKTCGIYEETDKIQTQTEHGLWNSYQKDEITDKLMSEIKECVVYENECGVKEYKVKREHIDGYCKELMKDVLVSGLVSVPKQYVPHQVVKSKEGLYYKIIKIIQSGDGTALSILSGIREELENILENIQEETLVEKYMNYAMAEIDYEMHESVKSELKIDKKELIKGIERAYKEVIQR